MVSLFHPDFYQFRQFRFRIQLIRYVEFFIRLECKIFLTHPKICRISGIQVKNFHLFSAMSDMSALGLGFGFKFSSISDACFALRCLCILVVFPLTTLMNLLQSKTRITLEWLKIVTKQNTYICILPDFAVYYTERTSKRTIS